MYGDHQALSARTNATPRILTAFSRRLLDLLVVEEVDDDRRSVKGPFHAVVVYNVREPNNSGVLTHGSVELLPVAAALPAVNLIIEGHKLGMSVPDVVHDDSLIAPAEVHVLEPNEAALIAHTVNYRGNVSNPGELKQVVLIPAS